MKIKDKITNIFKTRPAIELKEKALADARNLFHEGKPPLAIVEHTLANDWKELLGLDSVSVDDNFFELGGNYFSAPKAISNINKVFNIHLPLNTLYNYPTIRSLARALTEKKANKGRCLVPIKKGGDKIPLYMVTFIGGLIDRFCEVAYMLDPEQPVYGLQTPLDIEDINNEGFNIKEVALNYIENTASLYVSEILEQNPAGPYAISGYSYGGFIALEMANQLKQMGKEVILLVLFDTIVQGIKKCLPPGLEETPLKRLFGIYQYRKVINHKLRIVFYDNVYLLRHDRKKWFSIKKQSVKQLFFGGNTNKVKNEASTELKQFVQKRKELAHAIEKNYQLPFYDGEIVLFSAQRRSTYSVTDLMLGWKPFCKSVKVYKIDGDHLTIFKSFYCKRLAKRLQQVLHQSNNKITNAPRLAITQKF